MKQDERQERLFKTYYQQMYRLARTMLYDADESRDVVSDVFARIIQQQRKNCRPCSSDLLAMMPMVQQGSDGKFRVLQLQRHPLEVQGHRSRQCREEPTVTA